MSAANDVEAVDLLTQSVLSADRGAISLMFDRVANSVTSSSEQRFNNVMESMYKSQMV